MLNVCVVAQDILEKYPNITSPLQRADAKLKSNFNLVRGVRCEELKKKMDGGVGLYSTGGAEGARDQSYPLTIGMEEATGKIT